MNYPLFLNSPNIINQFMFVKIIKAAPYWNIMSKSGRQSGTLYKTPPIFPLARNLITNLKKESFNSQFLWT